MVVVKTAEAKAAAVEAKAKASGFNRDSNFIQPNHSKQTKQKTSKPIAAFLLIIISHCLLQS